MARVKTGIISRSRRKKILKLAKGYYGSKHTLYKTANEQVMRSLNYAYRDRKNRKREFRKLWIQRINAASKNNGLKYSKFINGLKLANININRKMLAELAVNNPEDFTKLVNTAKEALENPSKFQNTKSVKEEKVEEPVVVKEEVKKAEANLDDLSLTELKELAKEKGLKGYSSLKKSELIEALK